MSAREEANTDAKRLTLTALSGIPTIAPGADLAAIIVKAASRSDVTFQDGDVLVIAQKIISKIENRLVRLSGVTPSERAVELGGRAHKDPRLAELILRESSEILRCVPGIVIAVHHSGMVMANAGIDASNVEPADDAVLLLPVDADASAARLRAALAAMTKADIGIIINDSFGRAWRHGTVGVAIGVAGLPGLLDMRGWRDRTGRSLQSTDVGVADELAAAASLLMGQAGEGRPVIHVRGFPHARRDGSAAELVRPRHADLFRQTTT
jgi:coenzyme F420-0:L-glutamate ligase / coenzyme F420-1:gamma-L-glutamate ligase